MANGNIVQGNGKFAGRNIALSEANVSKNGRAYHLPTAPNGSKLIEDVSVSPVLL